MRRRRRDGPVFRRHNAAVVYSGAHHAFNSIRLRGKPEFYYGRLEYNEAADKAAFGEMLAAFREAFGN